MNTLLQLSILQGLCSLLTGRNSAAFVDECNRRISESIVPDVAAEPFHRVIDADLPLERVQELQDLVRTTKERVLVRFQFPFQIADEHVEVYAHVAGRWRTRVPKVDNAFVIGIHVRRGELFIVDSERMLPNSYYIEMARHAIQACKTRRIPYRVELYTEVPRSSQTVRQFVNGKTLPSPVILSPEDNELSDFELAFGDALHAYLDEDLLDTFDRMINCNLLVASRSSLSACASYLKDCDSCTLYHPFWHAMLRSDIPCNDALLQRRVQNCVDRWANMREI